MSLAWSGVASRGGGLWGEVEQLVKKRTRGLECSLQMIPCLLSPAEVGGGGRGAIIRVCVRHSPCTRGGSGLLAIG